MVATDTNISPDNTQAESKRRGKGAANGNGEKPKVQRNTGPKPAYVLINLPDGVSPEQIEVVAVTRKAEEALTAIDTGKAQKYLRVMVK